MVNLNYGKNFKDTFNLQGQLHFIYNQITHSIPKSWKDVIMANSENINNLFFQDRHLSEQIK